jgi:hypothetical protein
VNVVHYVVHSTTLDHMSEMEHIGYDEITEQVRIRLTRRVEEVLNSLTPYVNGAMGDVAPGHVQVFLAAAKLQGSLYRAFDRPVADGDRIPATVVARMLDEAREAAAEEARVLERVRIEAERTRALESGRSKLREELERVRNQGDV